VEGSCLLPSALVVRPDAGRLSEDELGLLSAKLVSATAAAKVAETLPLIFGNEADDEEEEEEEEEDMGRVDT
jgi:hypothetical protein